MFNGTIQNESRCYKSNKYKIKPILQNERKVETKIHNIQWGRNLFLFKVRSHSKDKNWPKLHKRIVCGRNLSDVILQKWLRVSSFCWPHIFFKIKEHCCRIFFKFLVHGSKNWKIIRMFYLHSFWCEIREASSIMMLLILFTEFDFSPLYGFNLWWIIDIFRD